MLHAKDIVTDWLKVGTMMAVSRWLSGQSLMDRSWQTASLHTLLGFTSYHLSTRNVVNTEATGEFKPIADDWVKVGTMMIVSRLLSGGNLMDQQWIFGCIATLVGFTVYHIVTSKYIKGSDMATNDHVQMAIDDVAKVGTMLLVSRLMTCQSVFDSTWASGSLATLVGFVAFDLVTSHLLDVVPLE